MDHSQYIIDKLEEARDERGMPIAELARRSGIHRKRLWYILNGERKLRADEFVRLIVVMGSSDPRACTKSCSGLPWACSRTLWMALGLAAATPLQS